MSGAVAELPLRLLQAGDERQPLLAAPYQDIQVAQGYLLQRAGLNTRCQNGEQASGWKVAFAGAAAQRRFGLDEPVYGGLTDAMVVKPGTLVKLSSLIQPKLEIELALILGRDLEAAFYSDTDILAAIDQVAPAFEIADCRWQSWQFGAGAFLADNAAAGLYCLAPTQPFEVQRHARFAFRLEHERRLLGEGVAGQDVDAPLANLCWLIRRLLSDRQVLRAGQVILSGALLPPLSIEPGEYRLAMLGMELALTFEADKVMA